MADKKLEIKKLPIGDIQAMKRAGKKITSITAYDYATARLVDEAGFDVVFVGDSLGMVCLGYDSTVQVTIDEVLHHLRAVARTVKRGHVVGDMPFGSYFESNEQAIATATKLMQAGADSVKVEGGGSTIERIRAIVDAGIPCWGHIGVTPQFIAQLGSYRVRGKDYETARRLFDDAVAIQEAGAWALQLEMVSIELSRLITETLDIPVFGAGCGPHCDGQGQNVYDTLGMFDRYMPRMSKKYVNLWDEALSALRTLHADMQEERFPTEENAFPGPAGTIEQLEQERSVGQAKEQV